VFRNDVVLLIPTLIRFWDCIERIQVGNERLQGLVNTSNGGMNVAERANAQCEQLVTNIC